MEYLPLLIIPSAMFILLTVVTLYKLSEKMDGVFTYKKNPLRKEKKPESYYFILIISMSLGLLTLAPWVGYYILSGAKLNLIDNFITQIFIMSLVVVITIYHHRKRDFR
jgi:hypothetical protein